MIEKQRSKFVLKISIGILFFVMGIIWQILWRIV